MLIKNKQESIKRISELNLNRCPEETFSKGDVQGAIRFMDKHKEQFYCIRSNGPMGKSSVGTREEILEEVAKYPHGFSICVSMKSYGPRTLTAEVFWNKHTNDFYIIASKHPFATNRELQFSPCYNIKTDIFDKKLNQIPGIQNIFDLIIQNNLFNIIVECAVYDREVGTNNSKVITYELRSHY